MNIEDLVDHVTEVPIKTDYWFVRTEDGSYFDTFYENNFIAIGWNYITLDDLKSPDSEKLRSKIIKQEKFDPEKASTKHRVTTIINKSLNFINLKKGDVIMIPSKSSANYAFGVIQSGVTVLDNNESFDCVYIKRKKIKWHSIQTLKQLDSHFYRLRSFHSISQINDYSPYIDNIINSLYRKDNKTHLVIDINTDNPIKVNALVDLILNLQQLNEEINVEFDLKELIEKNSIRLNLQSRGKFEIVADVGKSLVILATIISLTGCDPAVSTENPKMDAFIKTNATALDTVRVAMEELEVDMDKLKSINNGNH